MERLLTVMNWVSFALLALVLLSIRKAHIRVEYSVSWLVAAMVLVVLTSWRGLLESIAAMLGIEYPPFALLLVIVTVFLLVFYRFSVIISHLKDANIAMAQRVAILEYHLNYVRTDEHAGTR